MIQSRTGSGPPSCRVRAVRADGGQVCRAALVRTSDDVAKA